MRASPLSAVALVASTAVAAWLLSRVLGVTLLGFEKSPISPVSLAVVVGLVVARLMPGSAQDAHPVTTRFATSVLQWGVALLGLRLSLVAASALTLQALPVVLGCIVAAIAMVTGLGRLFGMPRALTTLIAVGTSICGISAIAATAPLIRARGEEISYATAVVTLFGLVAMFTYPWLAHAMAAADPVLAGIFLGTAVHDTSQVVGAAMAYEQQFGSDGVLEAAMVTKLLRNLAMVVVIPLMAIANRNPSQTPLRRLGAVPWFLYAFLALCALRTSVDAMPVVADGGARLAWDSLLGAATVVSEVCFMLAMSAIGLQTNLAGLRNIGLRPLALGFAAALCVGAVSAAALFL
jgi:uncharacterized integral membrane protein (TIGR00698 family)